MSLMVVRATQRVGSATEVHMTTGDEFPRSMTVQPSARPTPDPATPNKDLEANSAKNAEIRARAEAVLAKGADSRVIDKRGKSHSYRPVRVTIGEAEQLARDVLALTAQAAELRSALEQIAGPPVREVDYINPGPPPVSYMREVSRRELAERALARLSQFESALPALSAGVGLGVPAETEGE